MESTNNDDDSKDEDGEEEKKRSKLERALDLIFDIFEFIVDLA